VVLHRGLLPTGETVLFALGGSNLERRLDVQQMLSSEHWFAKKHVLWLQSVRKGGPMMSGRLIVDAELVEELTTGIVAKPRFSAEFPAEHIETSMEWSDLVLHPNTLRQIREIEHWITHNHTIMQEWGMKKKGQARLSCTLLWSTWHREDPYHITSRKTHVARCISY